MAALLEPAASVVPDGGQQRSAVACSVKSRAHQPQLTTTAHSAGGSPALPTTDASQAPSAPTHARSLASACPQATFHPAEGLPPGSVLVAPYSLLSLPLIQQQLGAAGAHMQVQALPMSQSMPHLVALPGAQPGAAAPAAHLQAHAWQQQAQHPLGTAPQHALPTAGAEQHAQHVPHSQPYQPAQQQQQQSYPGAAPASCGPVGHENGAVAHVSAQQAQQARHVVDGWLDTGAASTTPNGNVGTATASGTTTRAPAGASGVGVVVPHSAPSHTIGMLPNPPSSSQLDAGVGGISVPPPLCTADLYCQLQAVQAQITAQQQFIRSLHKWAGTTAAAVRQLQDSFRSATAPIKNCEAELRDVRSSMSALATCLGNKDAKIEMLIQELSDVKAQLIEVEKIASEGGVGVGKKRKLLTSESFNHAAGTSAHPLSPKVGLHQNGGAHREVPTPRDVLSCSTDNINNKDD